MLMSHGITTIIGDVSRGFAQVAVESSIGHTSEVHRRRGRRDGGLHFTKAV